MKTKQIGVLFLYLFCFQYVLGVAFAVRDGHDRYPDYWRGGRGKGLSSKRCSFSKGLQRKLNLCYRKAGEAPDYLSCPDQKNDQVELSKIRMSQAKLGKGSFNCRCESGGVIKIDMKILYLSLLLSGVLNLVGDLLGSLLGGLGKTVAGLLGKIVNLLLKILCLDIEADVTLKIVPGSKCVVEDVTMTNLRIKVLGLSLQLGSLIAKLLGPILLLLIKNLLVENFLKRFIDCVGIVNNKDINRY